MRKIPVTIASQHPDNAAAPYWDDRQRPFVSVHQEIKEAVSCFQDLGVSEYMWDWEGKHADAAVIDRLFTDYYDYFKETQLGRDKFLTFRIPNIWEEKGYNLLQAMTVILSSEDFARDLKFAQQPLFEVILPMTERANQLTHMQQLFERLAHFKSKDFTPDSEVNNDYLEMIPLVESVESQMSVDKLLSDYVKLHKEHFKREPAYIRSFLACSDSALSSGFLASVLGNKLALAKLRDFNEASGIPIFPFMGAGSLPFRGGLSPDNLDRFMQEFPGVRTVTVQSAFRYDYPLEDVKAAIQRLETEMPKLELKQVSAADQDGLKAIAQKAAEFYKQTLTDIAPSMQPVFKSVPKRRDRRQHIGLVAYARNMGGQTLPRAITFTGAFYSTGLPPELIGSGRALKALKPDEIELLKAHYPNLANDFKAAGYYLNKDNLNKFAAGGAAWQSIKEDVQAIETVLGIELGPETKDQEEHLKLSSKLISLPDDANGSELIEQMGLLRKSLG
jgi:phosphoenolpyruvate carboxylase